MPHANTCVFGQRTMNCPGKSHVSNRSIRLQGWMACYVSDGCRRDRCAKEVHKGRDIPENLATLDPLHSRRQIGRHTMPVETSKGGDKRVENGDERGFGSYLWAWDMPQRGDIEGVDEEPVDGGEEYWQAENEGERPCRVRRQGRQAYAAAGKGHQVCGTGLEVHGCWR